MVMLGFWQLGRADEKAVMIAGFADAQQLPPVRLENLRTTEELLYRNVTISCSRPFQWQAVAGRNLAGQTGYVHRYTCLQQSMPPRSEGGPLREIYGVIGWSQSPQRVDWNGGELVGVLAPMGEQFKVVATTPQAGLEPAAVPDPNDLPNNHLAYAGQWFFFALTALVIYWLALRRRWRESK
ncbi:MAG: SURF1 family protein [Erythrobacter sp.]|nr:MAG: SURF1 family protein [Erythrobacter sp.]